LGDRRFGVCAVESRHVDWCCCGFGVARPSGFGVGRRAACGLSRVNGAALRSREPRVVALVAAVVAIASVPFVPNGVPVLLAAGVAVVAGIGRRRGASSSETSSSVEVGV
jgi:hypothetical protein